jgi:hypothetical protein
MSDGYLPIGSDNDPRAPWNEEENPLSEDEKDDLREQEGEAKYESQKNDQ